FATDSPENYEIIITNPSITITTSFSIPLIFPTTISETKTNDSCSESNQLPRAQFSCSSLFPPAESETDSSSSKNDEIVLGQILPTSNLRIFSLTELKVATKNFSPDTVLGAGGFGKIFKGWLKDKGQSKSGNRMVIAVKKLNSESLQGFQEWQSYTAKISDFGLVKLGPSAGHLYIKSDVYGFGIVLVEILTGLRALDTNRPSGKQYLVDWIKPYLSEIRKLKQIMDPRLEGIYPSKAAFHISQLAQKCLAAEPKLRPSMKEVLEKLERFEAANERPREPRNHASHPMVHRQGQQPLHHRSPLHPRLDGNPAYQNSSRVSQ
ncbi:putative serine/threonine-protein kinase pix13, partial [Quercus suber]